MNPTDLFRETAQRLESLGITYVTTGSMASTVYGEPRLTNDIDLVIQVSAHDVDLLCAAFPDTDFYVSTSAAHDAAARKSQFNVIHPASGLKINFVVAGADEFNRSRFARARLIEVTPGFSAWFASPEDVIVRKLSFFREGGSSKHLRDIRGILSLCEYPIDQEYLRRWVVSLGLEPEWDMVRN